MKLKTRLLITFLISVFIPLFLMVFAFWTICVYLIQNGKLDDIKMKKLRFTIDDLSQALDSLD